MWMEVGHQPSEMGRSTFQSSSVQRPKLSVPSTTPNLRWGVNARYREVASEEEKQRKSDQRQRHNAIEQRPSTGFGQ